MRYDYDYLIVGAGMVSANATAGIRERDERGSIGIVGSEPNGPVTRPALSKKLWTDPEFGFDKIWMKPEDKGATLHADTRIVSLDRDHRTVTADNGDVFGYGRLLIATGGEPKKLDLAPSERVLYFRTVEDYRRLRELAGSQRHIAVVGGSYIGTELAAALALNDTRVTLIHPEQVLGDRVFPPDLARRFQEMYHAHGVTLMGGRRLASGRQDDDTVTLTLDSGETVAADAVALGLGVEPVCDFAAAAGLAVDDGIMVDEMLRTSDPNIFAAGDVASYPDNLLGRQRAEHVDNANRMGQQAGAIMAGSEAPYTHTPYFYSNVFELGYQAVGTLDSSLRTIEDWQEPQSRGVVYYLEEDVVKGVLLVNLKERLDAAREVIKERTPGDREALIGRIR
ncbi:apoptosis-inducing factor-like protein [Kushneria sinocarnis]|uniref:Apoptosis-inducing factor-like protein n=1 Tax=Kushneria sinocarnis TaxID=595502 RepID=A0A420WXD4_9GAMM|nr:FAD-dependent oxidoreductase [Kushneria sinocarnis]RKR04388.1 apoptosis-inducing factor-like protein [Kushneria sinocarnis]